MYYILGDVGFYPPCPSKIVVIYHKICFEMKQKVSEENLFQAKGEVELGWFFFSLMTTWNLRAGSRSTSLEVL